MSSTRRPWYPWYPKDFNGDEKVKCLPTLAELIYRRALDLMWQSNSIRIPNALPLLYDSLGSGIAENDFRIAWERIMYPDFELFETEDDGKWLFSKRLRREAEKIEELSNKKKKAGKTGASARWKKADKATAKQSHSKRKANAKQTDSHTYSYSDTDILKETNPGCAGQPSKKPKRFDLKLAKDYVSQIDLLCKSLNGNFKAYQWVQTWVNKNGHPQAIIDSLEGLKQRMAFDEPLESPWGYCEKIMKTKSGNYYEAENRKSAKDQVNFKEINSELKKLIELIG